LQHFHDFWYPALFERPMFDPQAERPRTSLFTRLNERARYLIEHHQPLALDEEVLTQLEALERAWDAR
jgi:trimethylamine:corrinoid methyltransferase-like protein